MGIKKLEAAIEAVLFAMGDSVELSQIAAAIQQDKETTRKLLHNLMDKYQKEDRGIQIIELEDAYQMCTKREYYECLIRLAMHPKKPALTDVMLETLSIIAYKQPVTKAEIEKIRGVKCDHAINKLMEYELVKELGRLDAPGKPILFGTTEEFLRCFGVQGLEELPAVDPVKLEDFKAEAERRSPASAGCLRKEGFTCLQLMLMISLAKIFILVCRETSKRSSAKTRIFSESVSMVRIYYFII